MGIITSNDNDGMMSDINITPLVDVMLVLLIVFIVTAPLLMNAVSVKLPKANVDPAITQTESAHISVDAQGDLYIDEVQVSQSELEAMLKQANNTQDYAVDIMADEAVSYGVVAKVMAVIQRAGITKFTFVMSPEASLESPASFDNTASFENPLSLSPATEATVPTAQ